MSKQLTEYKTSKGALELTPQEVKEYLVSGKKNLVTDAEVMHFIKMCFYQKLNPWLREAYLIKYSPESPASMVVGKDVFLKRASHNPKFQGHKAEATSDKDGTITGAWAEVYIKDYQVPIRVVVDFEEYNQDNRMWKNKPKTMIRKVALAQALREAFPEDFEGLYSEEEMPTGNVELERKPVKVVDIENGKIEGEITPEQIKYIKNLAIEIGYKKLNLAAYTQDPKLWKEDIKVFEKMKELIAKVKVLREERIIGEKPVGFLKQYGISDWNELHRVTPDHLTGMIDALRELPLANKPEEIPLKKLTKAEKIELIKDKILGEKELNYKENSPEVTRMLTPYGIFNLSQLVSLDGKTLDKILKEEFCAK